MTRKSALRISGTVLLCLGSLVASKQHQAYAAHVASCGSFYNATGYYHYTSPGDYLVGQKQDCTSTHWARSETNDPYGYSYYYTCVYSPAGGAQCSGIKHPFTDGVIADSPAIAYSSGQTFGYGYIDTYNATTNDY